MLDTTLDSHLGSFECVLRRWGAHVRLLKCHIVFRLTKFCATERNMFHKSHFVRTKGSGGESTTQSQVLVRCSSIVSHCVRFHLVVFYMLFDHLRLKIPPSVSATFWVVQMLFLHTCEQYSQLMSIAIMYVNLLHFIARIWLPTKYCATN